MGREKGKLRADIFVFDEMHITPSFYWSGLSHVGKILVYCKDCFSFTLYISIYLMAARSRKDIISIQKMF